MNGVKRLKPVVGAFYDADGETVFWEEGKEPVLFETCLTFVARDGRSLEMIYAPGTEPGEIAYHEN